VLHSTFVLLISICAKLKLRASKSPTSQSPETVDAENEWKEERKKKGNE
jgi:hypothetical protein